MDAPNLHSQTTGSNPFKATTAINVVPPNPYNVEAPKEFSFNETGNIMVASTKIDGGTIEKEVQDVFQEVSVFFAAMTKALTMAGDSLYDIEAVRKVIDSSGLFVHVTEEQVSVTYSQFSGNMSAELIEALLGLASGTGEMAFASAMVKAIGSHGFSVTMGHSSSSNKVGNIVFVCEYILGMAVVSAIVVYADATENDEWFKVGPCISGHSVQQALNMTKDTFLFVVPAAIKKYGGDLAGVENDSEYQALVRELLGYLDPGALPPKLGIIAPLGNTALRAVTTMTQGTEYQLTGENLGDPADGALSFAGENPSSSTLTVMNWSNDNIIFKPTAPMSNATRINIYRTANDVTSGKASGSTSAAYKVT